MDAHASQRGASLIELIVVIALASVMAGFAVPALLAGVDANRGAAAARYLAARMYETRFEAVKRSAFVALRFQAVGDDYTFTPVLDGNHNGVRTADIASGIDRPIGDRSRLGHLFTGVTFGLDSKVGPIDGGSSGNAADPIRLGASDILSFNPNGSSSSGTVYLRSRNGRHFAVRILGATGRTRVFAFNASKKKWQVQ